MKNISFILIFYLLFLSCDSARIYEENKKIKEGLWHQDDSVPFTVSINDSTLSYNMYVNIRNTGSYQFSNLFLFITTKLPNGQVAEDTLECTLADNEGRWLGSGLGDIWDNQFLLKKDFRFPLTGKYIFEIKQGMRVNPLPFIVDVGIRVEANK